MISEPFYWRKDLARIATQLENRQDQRFWRAGSYATLERLIMIGFYSARKLIEAEWVDPKLKGEQVHLTAFPSLGKRMDRMFWPEVDEYFDLSRPVKQNLPMKSVYDQIIHSFVFTPAFMSKRLVGIYFCSYEKKDNVYRAEICELVRVLRKTAGDPKRRLVLAPLKFMPELNRFDEAE